MPLGPGKYDDACTQAREATGAGTAVLIVIGGHHGPGFSVQSDDAVVLAGLPALLRSVADQIQASR